MDPIYTSTGDIPRPYEVIDTIFAMAAAEAKMFSGPDPGKAFSEVKKQLAQKCSQLGGNAVIYCQFEYRIALGDGLFGKKQVVELFAYGTAVRFINPQPTDAPQAPEKKKGLFG